MSKPHVAIVGQETLAAATRTCCRPYLFVTETVHDDTELLWVCYDTPIVNDRPDPEWVMQQIRRHVTGTLQEIPVLVSSQMPVGTIARLEQEFPQHAFAYSPENIRVATGVTDFSNQARVVVGRRSAAHDAFFARLFAPFTDHVIFTDPETAEMVKHALNCFLGLQIAWVNEIARLADAVGADPSMISKALLTESRVSPRAPLRPGAPFGGGHLLRDIITLNDIAEAKQIPVPIIAHIRASNEEATCQTS